MASDPYGRDGYDDRDDDIHPRQRPLEQEGGERGQRGFGGVQYPGHDYWGTGGQQAEGRDQRLYDGGWSRDDDRAGWNAGREYDDPYDSRGRRDRDEPPLMRDRAIDDDRGGPQPGHDDRAHGDRGYERSYDRGRGAARSRGGYDEDSSASSWRSKVRRKRKNMPLWQELPLLLIVAFCLAVLIRTFLVQAFFIPSGSMEETLLVGDRVLVNKVLYDVREPERGEVVVFQGPANWAPENQVDKDAGFFAELGRTVGDLVGFSQPGEKDFIKRVIGLPGDTVACCDVQGRVTVNGYPLDESSYIYEDSPLDAVPNPRQCTARRFDPVKVEPGQMFVMGDHRGVSQDSRCQGQVPIENVIGRAFVILWPSSRWGWLSVPDTFKNVPRSAAGPPGPHLTRAPRIPLVPDMVIAPLAMSLTVSTRSARQVWLRRR
ncbi:hypothetical protein GCM10010199_28710 [Dactylosporangium roseum]